MIDVNKPITNPELVSAMEGIQKAVSADTEMAYVNALKAAHFLSPVTISPRPEPGSADGTTTLKADTQISFVGISDADGNDYLPVFTDWEALRKWRDIPDEQTLIISYKDISSMVMRNQKSAGFVINPHSHNIPVRRTNIDSINAGPVTQWTVDKETTVKIGNPTNDPVDLKKAVIRHLQSNRNVKAAWLVLMDKGGELSFLVIVDFAGDRHATFSGIAAVAVPKLRQGELIDMAPADSELGKAVIKDYSPFYKRKTFRLFG